MLIERYTATNVSFLYVQNYIKKAIFFTSRILATKMTPSSILFLHLLSNFRTSLSYSKWYGNENWNYVMNFFSFNSYCFFIETFLKVCSLTFCLFKPKSFLLTFRSTKFNKKNRENFSHWTKPTAYLFKMLFLFCEKQYSFSDSRCFFDEQMTSIKTKMRFSYDG